MAIAIPQRRIIPLDQYGGGSSLDANLGGRPMGVPMPGRRRPMPPRAQAPDTATTGQGIAEQGGPPSMPADGGGSVSAITQLPDGAGGAVSVPPLALAPPSAPSDVTPSIPIGGATLPATLGAPTAPAVPEAALAPGAAAAPRAPWDGAPNFTADQNLIDAQVLPGANDPSRIDLAKQYYDSFADVENADYGHNLTDATNEAAQHGRLGSGMLTNRYGDLFSDLTLRKDAAKRGLVTAATEGTIGDNRSNRAETRTERDYQHSMAQEAIMRRILQNQQEFGNAATLYGLGNQNNPTADYLQASGQSSAEAGGSMASIQQLIQAMLARRSAGG